MSIEVVSYLEVYKNFKVLIGKIIYHSYYGIGTILHLKDGREGIYFYIDFGGNEIKLNHRGFGKHFYIVKDIQDVESVRKCFGNKVLIEVVFKSKKESNKDKLKEYVNEDKVEEGKYISYCYKCTREVNSNMKKCLKCGWYICRCGACGCGYRSYYRY